MPEQPPAFRDFGILPEDLPPPPDKVRSFLSPGRVVGQYIGTGLVAAVALGLTVLFALLMPLPLNLLAAAATLAGFGAFIYLATHNDYRWVELEGNTLRAKHLYTGRIVERSIEEIECLTTLVYQVRRIETVVIEKMLGRVKGIEIRFRDRRTPLRIMRSDPAMTNAKELIEAVIYRMGQAGVLDAEVIKLNGQPVVRHVYWQDEPPGPPPGKGLKVSLCCLLLLALMFGAVCSFWGLAEREQYRLGSVPPHELSVQSLIQNGPGDNRHVTITGFSPGGYTVETQNSAWSRVWVALFPAGSRPEDRKEIKVVLESSAVRDEADLRRLLQTGSVKGICSKAPLSWGGTLGANLVKANQGRELSSAWEIEEMRQPPSEARVMGILATSTGCFVAALLLATIVFFLKS